jgi:hypothetical protein
MQYDQKVIIKCLWNDEADARNIADRLQAQFGEHVYQLRTIWFWIASVWIGRSDVRDEIRTGSAPLHDLDAKILATLRKSPL